MKIIEAKAMLKTIQKEQMKGGISNKNKVFAIEMGIEALNRQIPKVPIDCHLDDYTCPTCLYESDSDNGIGDLYCPCCGQKLDWGAK